MSGAFTPGPLAAAPCTGGEACWCRIITVELYGTLVAAFEAIASLPQDAMGLADMSDRYTGDAVDYPIRDELLSNIEAVLSKARGCTVCGRPPNVGGKCIDCIEREIERRGKDDMDDLSEPEVCSNCGAYFNTRLNPTKWQRCAKCRAGLEKSA